MSSTTRESRTIPPILVGAPPAPERRRREKGIPSWVLKVAAAITGVIWAIFLAIHFYGNLKVFLGPEAFNGYAFWLREALYPLFPEQGVLWLMRGVLVPALIIHVVATIMIWARGRAARGAHRAKISGPAAWGAWLQPISGILILAFVIYHVLDLTVGAVPVATEAFRPPTGDVSFAYDNLVASFQRPGTAIFYVVVMLLLAAHIAKGFTNVAADMGAMGKRLRATLIVIGGLIAVAILLGNSAIPIAVQLGVVS